MKKIKFEGYEIIEEREVSDLNSYGYLLKHKKTGAHITILSNDDNNKVFYIGFRTPPADSTGVAHILEHSVLCGSDRFPAKDPFIELAKGSLNTFLNAMTYPDKTVYPVASCNDKDFANLMHVYLDAVFHPNIYKEDKIFKQEGWHYEMDTPEDDLTLNGVVYNEMKGAFSSPDDVIEREIMNSLYPDTTYGIESGGDPDDIPNLTYEAFLAFHGKYYHPSNSYIYLYGDMDLEERLAFLDREYLSGYDALEVDSAIPMQPHFTDVRQLHKQYSITEGESLKDAAYLTYNLSIGTCLDKKLYVAMDILDYALCSAPGAPLKQALLDRGIGKDVYTAVEGGILQPYFSIISKNTEVTKKQEFVDTIEHTLCDIVKKGIDKKALKAAINYFEFRYREADYGSYPKGLMFGLQALDSWLYDETAPFMHIEQNVTFAELKKEVSGSYFEDLVKEYLLDNTHKTILVVEPVQGLTAKKDQELQDKLKAYKATLSQEQIRRVVRETEELHAYQEEPSTRESLDTIPMLTREDMDRKAAGYINEVRKAGETTILFHDIFTNGIGYLKFVFDMKQVPQELLGYVGILKAVLMMVDTKHFSYGDLFHEINTYTGGMTAGVNTYQNAQNLSEYRATFEVRVKTLYENRNKAIALIKEILLTSDFTDQKRLYEIIAETQSRMQASMTSAGHSVAAIRAMSYFSRTAAVSEQISGIPQYRLLEQIEGDFTLYGPELTENLNRLVTCIFRPENLMVDYTAGEEGYDGLEQQIEDLRAALFTQPVTGTPFTVQTVKKNEAFVTAGQIQYVCRAGNFIEKGLPYTGALKALKIMIGYEYLWNQVRVKGGAYGCMCNFSRSGDSYFVSYRDPNLEKTIEIYEKAADFIASYQADERDLTQFIIGALGDLDTPMTPSAKGSYSLSGYMTGLPFEAIQREREELLSITAEQLQSLSAYVKAFMEKDCLCVVGNEEKIHENEELFQQVEQLFH